MGFFGGGFICEDNNECGDETIVEFTDDGVNYTDTMYDSHDCDAMATCFNMPGSFNCTCDDGYYGNGTHCADIDECGTESITLTGGIRATSRTHALTMPPVPISRAITTVHVNLDTMVTVKRASTWTSAHLNCLHVMASRAM